VPDSSWRPTQVGRESTERIERLVRGLEGELGREAGNLLARHSYTVDSDGGGPHTNVLGHPLIELPVWIANATGLGGDVTAETLSDVCESSLCGYLSVRAEDDYFDGHSDEPEATMMLSAFFRTRHQALLAPIVSDRRFWERFQNLWLGYCEAMLLERSLHDPRSKYGREEFDVVLDRSQPLEIPGNAVLSIAGRWDLAGQLSELVRYLTKATQLFNDFVDAPDDLAVGNYTWMVRRLGGLQGKEALSHGMIAMGDDVVAEVGEELDRASSLAGELDLAELVDWAEARKRVMAEASQRMYRALFGRLGSDG